MSTPVIELAGVRKQYPGEPPIDSLAGVDLTIYHGELVAIVGPSGSGKTTLLQIAGCMIRATSASPTTGAARRVVATAAAAAVAATAICGG